MSIAFNKRINAIFQILLIFCLFMNASQLHHCQINLCVRFIIPPSVNAEKLDNSNLIYIYEILCLFIGAKNASEKAG